MLEVNFDFNATPMAPLVTPILIYPTPIQWSSLYPSSIEFWYLGPYIHYYLCFTIYVTQTDFTRISDTIDFLPRPSHVPFPTCNDSLLNSSKTITHEIQNTIPTGLFQKYGESQLHALQTLIDESNLEQYSETGQKSQQDIDGNITHENKYFFLCHLMHEFKYFHTEPSSMKTLF